MTTLAPTTPSNQQSVMPLSNNAMAEPHLMKIALNVGIPSSTKDPKAAEAIASTIQRISGQRPVPTMARISISGFKTRKGMVVGMMATLRGRRMMDFCKKFIHITLPRTRDFWGLPLSSVDAQGNLSIGIREHLAFPEVRSDEVERIHGLQVTFVTNAKNRGEALAFFRKLGIPFKED